MRSRLLGSAIVLAAAMLVSAPRAGAQQAAAFSMVQGIPGVTVDLVAGGDVIADDVAPGALLDLTSVAGMRLGNLTLTSADGADVLVGPIASFDVPATGSWTLVAHLDESGEPTLTTYQNDVSPVAAGMARLTLRHTAAAPPIDLVIGDQRPVVNLAGGMAATVELPVGPLVDAHIAPTGGMPIADIDAIDLAADTTTIVYAVGSADDDTLDFVVQVIALAPGTAATTTTTAGATTTTVAGATTTTVAGATTTTTTTQVASLAPTAVNTGSPLDETSSSTLALVAAVGLALAVGAWLVRRRV